MASASKAAVSGRPPVVFVCYAHEDRSLCEEFLTVLRPLIDNGTLALWSDHGIAPGEDWRASISEAMQSASAAILLVTPHFFASDFITSQELPTLLEGAAGRGLKVLWVAASTSLYEQTSVEPFQCLNNPERALDRLKLAERKREMVEIARRIAASVVRKGATTVPSASNSGLPAYLRPTLQRVGVILLCAVLLGAVVYGAVYLFMLHRHSTAMAEEAKLEEYLKQHAIWNRPSHTLTLRRGLFDLQFSRGQSSVTMTKGWRAGMELPPSVEKRLAPPVTMGALSVAAIAVLTKKTRFALGAVVLTAVYGYLTGASAGSADRKSGDESHLVELLSSKPWLWQRAEKALDRACGKLETLPAIQMISSNELELYPSLAQCRVSPGRR